MRIIKGQLLKGESVLVDNTRFVDCTIEDCTLEYSGNSFTMERTELRHCRYVFYGPARGTLHFLQIVGLIDCDGQTMGEVDEVCPVIQ